MNPTISVSPADAQVLAALHPAVSAWFRSTFPALTPAQAQAWPLIQAKHSTLIAAPTGSGKTLTAFLAVLDGLFREALAGGGQLPDETRVVYISPLKALSNDIQVNLQRPLAGIEAMLVAHQLPAIKLRTAVRTGDTSQAERTAMRKLAPHIVVTTPESLYVLLGSASGRRMLATTRSVIVDEIHAVAGSKRGSHLALSLERLQGLCAAPLLRIGLSATQTPIAAVAQFLVGHRRPCAIVDIGHARPRDLAIEVPPTPLGAVLANDEWELIYDRLATLAKAHRTTLIFVNTRRLAERLARHLSERMGQEAVAAHHGSLAKEQRLNAEQRLKRGDLRVLIATASLELGIDIGAVELVCQIASPRSISAFLQRVGRSGHYVGGTPKGRLFATSRDDLLECAALLDCVRRGELDRLHIPNAPLDVLAQHIVAEVSNRECSEAQLLALVRGAQPYAHLSDAAYQSILRMLAEGYTGRQGVRSAWLHRDAVNGMLRGRRGSQLTAVTSGGAIPDNADYSVLLEPQGLSIGSVNEDFAVESIAGDIFQLGNAAYRIIRVEAGKVRVEDAHGQPPNIPFWLGEAPGRSDELSVSVARLRGEINHYLAQSPDDSQHAQNWLREVVGLNEDAASQIVDYLARACSALGELPTQDCLVMERFFDESGGTQLVIHSPYGSRVNRAWGLALRKRFCRTFNFELQAAATEDAIVLSLSTTHSFALDEVWRYLSANTAEHVLIQAVLDAPLFGVRWRWNASTALALPRYTGGRKVAPQIQRMKSEDLVATVFPDQVACLENIVGEREIPDHPLVAQTLDDCLHEALDAEAWLRLLSRMQNGEVRLLSRDLPAPSPLAAEILNARPYAFLDDAPLEERRTQAVLNRRWDQSNNADDMGALDAQAIADVRAEAWPEARNADELHEALMALACINEHEAAAQPHWLEALQQLAASGRAVCLQIAHQERLWLPRERLTTLAALYPQAPQTPKCAALPGFTEVWPADAALIEVIRARLSGLGPLTVGEIARPLCLPSADVAQALVALETQGYVLRGRFSALAQQMSSTDDVERSVNEEWCERHLLARIHRYTVKRLRREIEPVSLQDFTRFQFDWQRLAPGHQAQGSAALSEVLAQLEGFSAAAPAWENSVLPARIKEYSPLWLDALCSSGKIVWSRLNPANKVAASMLRSTPIVLLPRAQVALWNRLSNAANPADLSLKAQRVHEVLQRDGALFFDELSQSAHLLRSELETALQELVAAGLVHADSFAGLRALVTPAGKRVARSSRRGRGAFIGGMDDAGRWALLKRETPSATPNGNGPDQALLEHICWTLLRRYGVVFWRLLEREADWLPRWRDLLRALQRLEARGEIRGGRFVAGLSGEQFALPEALPLLREIRKRPLDGTLITVSASDPLNWVGTLLPGTKIPALAQNRLVYRDGVPVAATIGGKVAMWVELDAADQVAVRSALTRQR